jgi:phenylacetate 2-hydroxylase
MAFQTIGLGIIAIIFFAIKYLNRTDTPKIKNLPEIPGYPLFGSLLELGTSHAKVAGRLAKQYGDVFQVRLGNRVCLPTFSSPLPS